MPYYNTCPNCGANLDPGERCDCKPNFLSVQDLAKRWNVSTDLVYDTIKSGTLQAIKIGGTTWRIPTAAIEAYEQANTAGSVVRTDKKPKQPKRKPVLRV